MQEPQRIIKSKSKENRIIGCIEFIYNTLESTMLYARELAEKEFPEGTVVIAEEQTQGMGRNGRSWISPKGGLWLSVILRPRIDTSHIFIVSYIISLSIAEAIRKLGVDSKIKWPNDVLIGNKKVAGILIDTKSTDTEIEHVIAGIGINVNNEVPKFHSNAIEGVSIRECLGKKIKIEKLKNYLYDSLEKNYSVIRKSKGYWSEILNKWDKFNFLKGRIVKIYNNDFSKLKLGKVIGINDNTGGLIVEVDSEIIEIFDSSTIRI